MGEVPCLIKRHSETNLGWNRLAAETKPFDNRKLPNEAKSSRKIKELLKLVFDKRRWWPSDRHHHPLGTIVAEHRSDNRAERPPPRRRGGGKEEERKNKPTREGCTIRTREIREIHKRTQTMQESVGISHLAFGFHARIGPREARDRKMQKQTHSQDRRTDSVTI